MIRVMHLIVGLGTGGAEVNLYRLVKGMDKSRFENIVVSLMPAGSVREAIEECGVRVVSLNITKGRPNPLAILRLMQLMREWKPDLLQTWMYHADLLGGITARILSGPPVIWNIRNSNASLSRRRVLTQAVARLCSRLSSSLPERIVSCSNAGRDCHAKQGYPASRIEVIFNGYDTNYFRPDPHAREALRAQLGLGAEAKLVAIIARFHPLKDHACFLDAARLVRNADPNVYFILCGDAISWENGALAAEVDSRRLRDRVFLLGTRADVNFIMAAASVVVSSSTSEGFPNVLAEAMACGTSCVATDVGDSRHIIGDTGIVVPPSQPALLAAGIVEALTKRDSLARNRIVTQFSLDKMIEKYERLYEDVSANGRQDRNTLAREPTAVNAEDR